jgi:hypothetical protein
MRKGRQRGLSDGARADDIAPAQFRCWPSTVILRSAPRLPLLAHRVGLRPDIEYFKRQLALVVGRLGQKGILEWKTHEMPGGSHPHCGLMFAARITSAHFSVS